MQPQQEAYICLNKHGNIIFSSESVETLFGYSPASLVGRPMQSICANASALLYLHELLLLKGYAENFRLCLIGDQGQTLLLDCCASRLFSPTGEHEATELLLKTLVSREPEPPCARLKVSIHANVLQGNTKALNMMAQFACQVGKPLPMFLAEDVFQAWNNDQVITKEYDRDMLNFYIIVPKSHLSLVIVHILPKYGLKTEEFMTDIQESIAA